MKQTQSLHKKLWFITGSQHLYGPETLAQVGRNAATLVAGMNDQAHLPVVLLAKAVVTTTEEILRVCQMAQAEDSCIGVVLWMHTFSPAKMWIRGLQSLTKPICHLHTQFNAEIPWERIDMDFMNLNQSAHGDREFGFMMTQMRRNRKVIVGHWQHPALQNKLSAWARVALGWAEMQQLKVARIGDNMREVAVTEGNKVSAQLRFGFSVNGYSVEDLMAHREAVTDNALRRLIEVYEASYVLSPTLRAGGEQRASLLEAARIELTLKSFLEEGGFGAFTDTFENLGELKQLPGIAVQRLMEQGYGFGAEGDWKTAALLRSMKVMSGELPGGTSFMEDYTYHFTPEKSYVLGAHMLEICPSIASSKPSCEIHPLGIGGKQDPVRLVFDGQAGDALNASLIDMGNRFRLIVNEVKSVAPIQTLPKLPVARVLWAPEPNLDVAATSWILAGGAHHTVYTQALTTDYLEDLADIAGIELLVIDERTRIRDFKDKLHANEAYYHGFLRGY